ncbi:MAG: DsrE family protein [Desulfitobacteriaceae bacterium]|nr:DsrE family protein [Desulfitobacteriaceae bacterium]MDI6879421.1 DsrE family protein [Desulfitobacteriaceae bacterium]MDI6914699.1 DsrE family protein [Desulfitobacteriaceae bacterium]
MSPYKILFHVNELERWPVALLNLVNLIKDIGKENLQAEVVANGPAVLFYAASPEFRGKLPATWSDEFLQKLLHDMQEIQQLGVPFLACANALKMNALEERSLHGFVTVVPAGITEIVKKQSEGYGYVKP